MTDLKKSQYELLPLDRSDVPADVLELVEKGHTITNMKRFRARNWRKQVNIGFAFARDNGSVVVIEEGCSLRDGNRMVPAWGVSITTGQGDDPIAYVVDGLFCHTAVKVGLAGYNVPVRDVA